ncbi:lipid binding protein, putative [Ricinus communis]|uniref:Lipid binding protein, putative n=1 Tax=Ricinus communis TaxID=3988 RepID=B9RGF9_RICCO|nr:lipid binding protein, putative [Ricinus communis]|eukprot:XP_002513111.1 uncharacterized protein LOC8260710 [Ricinus communis]
MANLNVYFMAIAGIIMIGNDKVALDQGCQGDLQGLITECAKYVQKLGPERDPSQGCCNVIKSVDIPCAFKYISDEIEDVIDMGKVVHVAEFCDKALPHGMKCGSYTVP